MWNLWERETWFESKRHLQSWNKSPEATFNEYFNIFFTRAGVSCLFPIKKDYYFSILISNMNVNLKVALLPIIHQFDSNSIKSDVNRYDTRYAIWHMKSYNKWIPIWCSLNDYYLHQSMTDMKTEMIHFSLLFTVHCPLSTTIKFQLKYLPITEFNYMKYEGHELEIDGGWLVKIDINIQYFNFKSNIPLEIDIKSIKNSHLKFPSHKKRAKCQFQIETAINGPHQSTNALIYL